MSSLRPWLQAGFTTLLMAMATVIVYITGGTSLVYVHLIYLPILVGGFFFGLAAAAILFAASNDRMSRFVEGRSEEHTSELQSLMRISYAVFCLKKKKNK